MSTGVVLDQDSAAEVLDNYNAGKGLNFARQTIGNLMDQGYALVAISGPALERAAERGDLSSLPPAAPEQAARIEQWCSPGRVS